MKIAVLMSGQARHIDRSAEFWTRRTFPPNCNALTLIIYIMGQWRSNCNNMPKNIHNAKVVDVSNYDEVVTKHIENVKNGNNEATDWWLAPIMYNIHYVIKQKI